MVLADNTKLVSRQLFGWDSAKLGPLRNGYLYYLMFGTELLLVWPVGHMDANITDWPLNQVKSPEMAIYQIECDALTFRAIRNTLYYVWQSHRRIKRDFWINCKGGRVILK